ncbi:hypothetical protein [Pedobacter gandavensis]|uniref:hypothetical protein n=1 Tax=Pedobacter gandavensis TaxID=2679963 RepID=UPI00292D6DBF|nr:hypothetical protein [Pedobacter gandavensis]
MKSLYKTIGLLFLFSAIFTACKKEPKSENIVFPVNFYVHQLKVKSGVRLFTKDGEVTDPIKISKFAGHKDFFNIKDSLVVQPEFLFSITSLDSARFTIGNYNNKYTYEIKGNKFLFSSAQVFPLPENSPELNDKLFKYQSVINLGMYQVQRPIQLAYGDFKAVELPMQIYYIARRTESSYHITNGFSNNEINESFLTTLKNQDTLAYRTYHLICKAQ